MRRILVALVAALGLALASGTALAERSGGHSGGGHSGGGHSGGGWHGGGHSGGSHGGNWHGGHGWRGGSHFTWGIGLGFPGFYWGPGWGYPYYAGYPYSGSYPSYAPSFYYGDEPAYESAPSTYIQRDMNSGPSNAAPMGESQYSYYCPDPAGYYPQIQACPKGWLKVVPDGGSRPRPR